jgi:hypothetical protein
MEAAIEGEADNAVKILQDHYRMTGDIILESDFDFAAE